MASKKTLAKKPAKPAQKSAKKPAQNKPKPKHQKPDQQAVMPPTPADSDAAKVLHHLLTKLPPLDPTTREAFRSLAPDSRRADLGRKTKARGVLADGVAMAVTIDRTLASFPSLSATYTPERFAYFLESLLALDALLAASTSREQKLGAARGAALSERDRAVQARRRLLARLDRFAGEREPERRALDSVPPQGRTNDELRASIQQLIELADSWIARSDPASIALRRAAALEQGMVDQAREAAKALGEANVGATLEGRKTSNDAPIVNLEEGNVLLSMMYAMDVFDEAHDENDVIPRLVPGPATRHALRSPIRAAEPEGAPGAEPPADASPAGPASPGQG
jgi:hypothetical protein